MILLLSLLFIVQQNPDWNTDRKGVAIDGYDLVSYFQGSPAEGNQKYSVSHKGAIFLFGSEKNKTLFKENPSKYLPKYGGYCAYAMGSSGEKVEVDPETYKILDDRLYLFYNAWGNNTLKSWNKNETHLKQNADENWKRISSSDK